MKFKREQKGILNCFLFVRATAKLVCHQICGEERRRVMFWIVFAYHTYSTYLDMKCSSRYLGRIMSLRWEGEAKKGAEKEERVNSSDFFFS